MKIHTPYHNGIHSASDYYPFGMLEPGRNFPTVTDTYRYGFIGQMKVNDIYNSFGSICDAEFWEYDTRIGRRWNADPVMEAWQSRYACFYNNTIFFTDPFGLMSGPGDPLVNILRVNKILKWGYPIDGVEIKATPLEKPKKTSKIVQWFEKGVEKLIEGANKVIEFASDAEEKIDKFNNYIDHTLQTIKDPGQGKSTYEQDRGIYGVSKTGGGNNSNSYSKTEATTEEMDLFMQAVSGAGAGQKPFGKTPLGSAEKIQFTGEAVDKVKEFKEDFNKKYNPGNDGSTSTTKNSETDVNSEPMIEVKYVRHEKTSRTGFWTNYEHDDTIIPANTLSQYKIQVIDGQIYIVLPEAIKP